MMSWSLSKDEFFWVLEGLCSLHHKQFSRALCEQQMAAPYSAASLATGAVDLGFEVTPVKIKAENLYNHSFPLVAWMFTEGSSAVTRAPALILQASRETVLIVQHSDTSPRTIALEEFVAHYSGHATTFVPVAESASDTDKIDKVIVHHAKSTLFVLAIGLAVFMLFSAGLTWVRQYLV